MLSTRLTQRLNIRHPIVSAPMAFAAGGRLAAAVSHAGGLGLIGGGYGDNGWLENEFKEAGNASVGCGFITWSLRKSPSLLSDVLKHAPRAVMLSFGDPRPFVPEIRAAGALAICQCQDIGHVWDAIDAGADIVVAQGTEAGGHGASRALSTLLPEAADLLAREAPDMLLLGAGGIADGRGLAAALALGADGVLMGTRLWAASEALVAPRHHEKIIGSDGDGTLRTSLPDIARQLPWPRGFTARIAQNEFTERWRGREDALAQDIATQAPLYRQAFAEGDPEKAAVWFGEAAGLIHDIAPAGEIIERVVAEAEAVISRLGSAAARG
jgi:nitronate monooxygenase